MIRHLEARARLPRLGVIRLGVKVRTNGKEYPKETSWFVLPDELRKLLGDRPEEIEVLFPSDDISRTFPCDYTRYEGKLATLKCDGEEFVEFPKAGGERRGKCQKPADNPYAKCPCGAKAQGRLNVIILHPEAQLGIWQVLIGGEQRVADLWMELRFFRQLFGRLTDLPFLIKREAAESQIRKEDGTRLARTGYPVHVRCREFGVEQALKIRGMDFKALPELVGTAKALPEAHHEEEAEEVVVDPDENGQGEESKGGEAPSPVKDTVQSAESPKRTTPELAPPPVRDSLTQGDAFDEARAVPAPTGARGDPWTLERCFQAAEGLGVTARAYQLFLRHKYGADPDNPAPETLAEEAEQFERAQRDGKVAEAVKHGIIAGANKASKGRSHARVRR